MKIYKTVPYAGTLVIEKNAKVQTAIIDYFDVIKQEAVDGWEFVSVAPITVIRKDCGLKGKDEAYNAFIFAKEV